MTNLSASQQAALSGLLDITSQMDRVNTRLQTNKSIASILDGPATFLQAQRLTDRQTSLLDINKKLDLGISALTSAQSAIAKVKKDLQATLTEVQGLKGTTQGTNNLGVAVDEQLLGIQGTAAGEVGTLRASQPASVATPSLLASNMKVFGTGTYVAPGATTDGTFGVASGTLTFTVTPSGTTGARTYTLSAGSADFTLGDLVAEINKGEASAPAATRLTAAVDVNGRLALTGPSAPVSVNFRSNGADVTNRLLGTTQTGPATSFVSSLAPVAVPATLPATYQSLVQNYMANTVAVFGTASGPTYGPGPTRLTGGALGASGVLAFRIADGTNSDTLTVSQGELSTNTMNGLVSKLNEKWRASRPATTTNPFALDATTGALTYTGGLGGTVQITQSATAADATGTSATSMNAAFGLPTSGATNASSTATTAASVSVIGDGTNLFQAGDMFRIAVTNTSTNAVEERFLMAVAPGDAVNNGPLSGQDKTQPLKFSTMQDLVDALGKFDGTKLQATAVKTAGTGTNATQFQLRTTLKTGFALEIEQVANGGAGTMSFNADGTRTERNRSNNLAGLFGSVANSAAARLNSTTSGESLIASATSSAIGTTTTRNDYGTKITYNRNDADLSTTADPKRRAAAATMRKVLDQIDATRAAASVDGVGNLLSGTVDFRTTDTGGKITLGLGAVGTLSTGGLGFAAGTNTYALLSSGLAQDSDVDAVVNAITGALATIEAFSSELGGQAATLVNSKDFNQDVAKILGEAATTITKNDQIADTAELKALDLRYSLAMASTGILNNAAASAIQLLR